MPCQSANPVEQIDASDSSADSCCAEPPLVLCVSDPYRLLEETRKDYVLLAKAKGMSQKRVLFFHCVKNIMPSFISLMAISLQHVIEGTYIVEMVFSYPGIGTLSFESAKYHDYNMLMVLCVFTGIFVLAGNVIGQSVSEWIDPRMKEIKMTGKADMV